VGEVSASQRSFTPVEQSVDLLGRIVRGEFDHLSGGLIAPDRS